MENPSKVGLNSSKLDTQNSNSTFILWSWVSCIVSPLWDEEESFSSRLLLKKQAREKEKPYPPHVLTCYRRQASSLSFVPKCLISSSKVKEPNPSYHLVSPRLGWVGLKCKPRSSKFFNWELFIMSDMPKKKKKQTNKQTNKHSLS
jgi:hypothetical protein